MDGFRSRVVCLILPVLLAGASARAALCLEWWCDPVSAVDHAVMHGAADDARADAVVDPSCHRVMTVPGDAIRATGWVACDDLFSWVDARVEFSPPRPDGVPAPAVLTPAIASDLSAAARPEPVGLTGSDPPPDRPTGAPLVLRI